MRVLKDFFQLLKRERIELKTYVSRNEARHDIFDYIEKMLQQNVIVPSPLLDKSPSCAETIESSR
jgi:hypothetical protein